MEIKTKVEFGDVKKLVEALSKEYAVKIGLLANKGGNDEVTQNLDMAGLGAVHEFGAEIEHPGGTPYFINEYGMATFVKKDSFYGQLLIARGQVTKPHNISIPARSWLSMPLSRNNGADVRKKLQNAIKKYGVSKSEFIAYIAQTGDLVALGIAIGSAGQDQILDAFESQGFGEWAPNAPSTIARKHSEDPLVDLGTLKSLVNYEVTENG